MDPTVSHAERTQRRARMRALLLHAAKARAPDVLALSKEKPLFAPYSPSPDAIIHAVWAFLETQQRPLTSADRLVDLGCGDGRWLISGVQRYNCSALGIELDPALVERAKQNVHLAELAHLIDVIQADIMATDITNATFVIVYAFAESLSGIREYLEKQLSKQASVLSIGFRVPEWKPEWSDRAGGLRWYLYDIKSLRG
ncbi:hypothetical protein Poli38472_004604 [Pythium oligandrum]|uniref:Methyltransferase domain-containing protein n=1 Tax=Pythium oligandrum TaxID=41045 RepID=A0A8K1FDL0_PYTOL|nr:hypothetical protein Poli38472_004604 [Pythium oligandrum]|eukprot:TMW59535.1 hypothetical protein Poli38472_004604 [Pythium oligandrum]